MISSRLHTACCAWCAGMLGHMLRLRPDGSKLTWRVACMSEFDAPGRTPKPFFITWDDPTIRPDKVNSLPWPVARQHPDLPAHVYKGAVVVLLGHALRQFAARARKPAIKSNHLSSNQIKSKQLVVSTTMRTCMCEHCRLDSEAS